MNWFTSVPRSIFFSLGGEPDRQGGLTEDEEDEDYQVTRHRTINRAIKEFVEGIHKAEIPSQVCALVRPHQAVQFTQDLTAFSRDIVTSHEPEDIKETIDAVSSAIMEEGPGHSYYLWVFSDLPQPEIVKALELLEFLEAPMFVIRCHSQQETPQILNKKFMVGQGAADIIVNQFYQPFRVTIRMGVMSQCGGIGFAPGYVHQSSAIDILGFSPMHQLHNFVSKSWHQVVATEKGQLIPLLEAALRREETFGFVYLSSGQAGVLLPAPVQGLTLVLLNSDHPLPGPWNDQFNGDLRSGPPMIRPDTIWAHQPTSLLRVLYSELPLTLPNLVELLREVDNMEGTNFLAKLEHSAQALFANNAGHSRLSQLLELTRQARQPSVTLRNPDLLLTSSADPPSIEDSHEPSLPIKMEESQVIKEETPSMPEAMAISSKNNISQEVEDIGLIPLPEMDREPDATETKKEPSVYQKTTNTLPILAEAKNEPGVEVKSTDDTLSILPEAKNEFDVDVKATDVTRPVSPEIKKELNIDVDPTDSALITPPETKEMPDTGAKSTGIALPASLESKTEVDINSKSDDSTIIVSPEIKEKLTDDTKPISNPLPTSPEIKDEFDNSGKPTDNILSTSSESIKEPDVEVKSTDSMAPTLPESKTEFDIGTKTADNIPPVSSGMPTAHEEIDHILDVEGVSPPPLKANKSTEEQLYSHTTSGPNLTPTTPQHPLLESKAITDLSSKKDVLYEEKKVVGEEQVEGEVANMDPGLEKAKRGEVCIEQSKAEGQFNNTEEMPIKIDEALANRKQIGVPEIVEPNVNVFSSRSNALLTNTSSNKEFLLPEEREGSLSDSQSSIKDKSPSPQPQDTVKPGRKPRSTPTPRRPIKEITLAPKPSTPTLVPPPVVEEVTKPSPKRGRKSQQQQVKSTAKLAPIGNEQPILPSPPPAEPEPKRRATRASKFKLAEAELKEKENKKGKEETKDEEAKTDKNMPTVPPKRKYTKRDKAKDLANEPPPAAITRDVDPSSVIPLPLGEKFSLTALTKQRFNDMYSLPTGTLKRAPLSAVPIRPQQDNHLVPVAPRPPIIRHPLIPDPIFQQHPLAQQQYEQPQQQAPVRPTNIYTYHPPINPQQEHMVNKGSNYTILPPGPHPIYQPGSPQAIERPLAPQVPIQASIQTPVVRPNQTPIQASTQAPILGPGQTPIVGPGQVPIQASIQTPVVGPGQIPIQASIQVSTQVPIAPHPPPVIADPPPAKKAKKTKAKKETKEPPPLPPPALKEVEVVPVASPMEDEPLSKAKAKPEPKPKKPKSKKKPKQNLSVATPAPVILAPSTSGCAQALLELATSGQDQLPVPSFPNPTLASSSAQPPMIYTAPSVAREQQQQQPLSKAWEGGVPQRYFTPQRSAINLPPSTFPIDPSKTTKNSSVGLEFSGPRMAGRHDYHILSHSPILPQRHPEEQRQQQQQQQSNQPATSFPPPTRSPSAGFRPSPTPTLHHRPALRPAVAPKPPNNTSQEQPPYSTFYRVGAEPTMHYMNRPDNPPARYMVSPNPASSSAPNQQHPQQGQQQSVIPPRQYLYQPTYSTHPNAPAFHPTSNPPPGYDEYRGYIPQPSSSIPDPNPQTTRSKKSVPAGHLPSQPAPRGPPARLRNQQPPPPPPQPTEDPNANSASGKKSSLHHLLN